MIVIFGLCREHPPARKAKIEKSELVIRPDPIIIAVFFNIFTAAVNLKINIKRRSLCNRHLVNVRRNGVYRKIFYGYVIAVFNNHICHFAVYYNPRTVAVYFKVVYIAHVKRHLAHIRLFAVFILVLADGICNINFARLCVFTLKNIVPLRKKKRFFSARLAYCIKKVFKALCNFAFGLYAEHFGINYHGNTCLPNNNTIRRP